MVTLRVARMVWAAMQTLATCKWYMEATQIRPARCLPSFG